METLIVTFSRAHQTGGGFAPVAVGSGSRTEVISTLTDGTGAGELSALAGERFVELRALAACWYEIGTAPTATPNASRYLAEGERADFLVSEGDSVAIEAAA